MIELVDRDIKTFIMTIFHILLERLRMSTIGMQYILKTQIEHLDLKTTVCEMKNILHGIYSKLVQEKRLVNLKPNQYKSSKIKGSKNWEKMNRVSESYQTTLEGLKYM